MKQFYEVTMWRGDREETFTVIAQNLTDAIDKVTAHINKEFEKGTKNYEKQIRETTNETIKAFLPIPYKAEITKIVRLMLGSVIE